MFLSLTIFKTKKLTFINRLLLHWYSMKYEYLDHTPLAENQDLNPFWSSTMILVHLLLYKHNWSYIWILLLLLAWIAIGTAYHLQVFHNCIHLKQKQCLRWTWNLLHFNYKNTAKRNMSSAVCASSMYSRLCMKMSFFLFLRACAMPRMLYLSCGIPFPV